MDAMDYEYLLRRIYQCGRHGAKGADADIYRKLERAEVNLTNVHWNKTQEVKEHDYYTAFAEVRMHVRNALREGVRQVEYRLSDEEIKLFEKIREEVNKLGFYNKKRLDEIIDQADDVFRKYGLEAR